MTCDVPSASVCVRTAPMPASDASVCSKYWAPFIGPNKVIDVDDGRDNYTLALPVGMRLHPAFHVSMLGKFLTLDIDRAVSRPGPDRNNEFEVENIIGTRTKRETTIL